MTMGRAERESGGLGEDTPGSMMTYNRSEGPDSKSIVLLGGSSPRPPFSRFARPAVTGKVPSLPCKSHQLDASR